MRPAGVQPRAAVRDPLDMGDGDFVLVAWMTLDAAPGTAAGMWAHLLCPDEAARATRFVHAHDRDSFVAAHAVLRLLLRRLGHRPARAWRFVPGAHGKPAIEEAQNPRALDVNLSHARGAVACAVARGGAVGVDIEDTDRAVGALDLAQAYFAAEETARLRAAAAPEQEFFRLWTLKEAAVKALGLGLHAPLDRLVVAEEGACVRIPDEAPACWQFRSMAVPPRHRLAVAARHAPGATPPPVVSVRIGITSDGGLVPR